MLLFTHTYGDSIAVVQTQCVAAALDMFLLRFPKDSVQHHGCIIDTSATIIKDKRENQLQIVNYLFPLFSGGAKQQC